MPAVPSYQKPQLERQSRRDLWEAAVPEPLRLLPVIIVAVDVAVIILDGVTFRRSLGRPSSKRVGPQLTVLGPATA